MGRGTGRLAPLLIAVAAPGAGLAQEASDACAVLTNAEFTELSGRTAFTEPTPMALGSGSVCGYDGGQIILFPAETGWDDMDRLMASFGVEAEKTPVPELGEGAYVFFVDPESEYQDHAPFLTFAAGEHILSVSVYAEDGALAETALPETMNIAKAVAARLR